MFADRLKELRKKRYLTQDDLAKAVGIDKTSIAKYEGKSRIMPSYDVLISIANYFGVSINYLLDVPEPARRFSAAEVADAMERDEKTIKTADELQLLRHYRSLNPDGRATLLTTAESFALNPAFKQDGIDKAI